MVLKKFPITALLASVFLRLPSSSHGMMMMMSSVRSSSKRPTVAIIGGGIAGLSCANRLADNKNFHVTVFDTGRLRPGGRCSSRAAGDPPKEDDRAYPILSKYSYDHASQILTIPQSEEFAEFRKQVEEWKANGVLTRYPDQSVREIHSIDKLELLDTSNMYYGSAGMKSIPMAMVDDGCFDLKQDVWVSPSSGARYMHKSKQWKLQASGQVLGYFDRLVVAHNGKCADRLLSKTPAKAIHSLLRVNFAPTVPAHGGKRMTLNSIYSLTIALPKKGSVLSAALKEPFIAGFVRNHKDSRFLSCQTRKYGDETDVDDDENAVEVWNILSSASFAKKHKAPQEFLSDETVEEVSTLLLKAVEETLELPATSLSSDETILDRRLQLWGAALPLNTWENSDSSNDKGFLYDAEFGVGVCGDWLVEASIAGAWTSGRRLADFMISAGVDMDASVGLEGSFHRSESTSKSGIGALV